MPIDFFLSSIAAGTALVILVEMWIAKAWHRPLRIAQLAALGKVTFWALAVYLSVRIGEMAVRGVLPGAFNGKRGVLRKTGCVLWG
jgi:formate dehydrogenase iron-sulfur subunit